MSNDNTFGYIGWIVGDDGRPEYIGYCHDHTIAPEMRLMDCLQAMASAEQTLKNSILAVNAACDAVDLALAPDDWVGSKTSNV